MSIGLIVVAYHRPALLGQLLESAKGDVDEVVVVNVESDPAIAAVAHRFGAATIDIPNLGFATAVNAGVAAARSDIAVVANDDVRFLGDAIRMLADVAESRHGVVAPAIVGSDGAEQLTIAANVSLRSLVLEWMVLPDRPPSWWRGSAVQKWRRPADLEAVPGVAAAVVVAARSLFVEHPMPEQYFMYWEEREWFTELARRGEVVWYQPRAVVEHVGGRDTVNVDKQRLLVRNAVRAVRRTRGRSSAVAAVPIVIGWQLRGLVLAAATRKRAREPHLARARWAGFVAALGSVAEVVRSERRP